MVHKPEILTFLADLGEVLISGFTLACFVPKHQQLVPQGAPAQEPAKPTTPAPASATWGNTVGKKIA